MNITYEEMQKGINKAFDEGYQLGFAHALRKMAEHDWLAAAKRYKNLVAWAANKETETGKNLQFTLSAENKEMLDRLCKETGID